MSSEMWRVVLASGEVREVEVRPERDEGCPTVWSCGSDASSRSARDAVLLWIADEAYRDASLLVAEILAPGVPTRAEAIEAARREGAEEMRWQASEAAEAWLRAVEEVTQDSPEDIADAIRDLPLPGDGDGGAS